MDLQPEKIVYLSKTKIKKLKRFMSSVVERISKIPSQHSSTTATTSRHRDFR